MKTPPSITVYEGKKNGYVVTEFMNRHKAIAMCHQDCIKFIPGDEKHCKIAQQCFELSKTVGIVLPLVCDRYLWAGSDADDRQDELLKRMGF